MLRASAFTLFELLLVLVLIALFAGLAAVAPGLVAHGETDARAADALGDLALRCQSEARRGGTVVELDLDLDRSLAQAVVVDASGTRRPLPGRLDDALALADHGRKPAVRAVRPDGQEVAAGVVQARFDAQGQCDFGGGAFVVGAAAEGVSFPRGFGAPFRWHGANAGGQP